MRATILPKAIILTKGHGQYDDQGLYCGLSTASEVFLIFTTQLYRYFSVFLLFVLFSDKPEGFLPDGSKYTINDPPHGELPEKSLLVPVVNTDQLGPVSLTGLPCITPLTQ